MKIRNAFFAKAFACCLLLALVFTCGVGSVSANAAEIIDTRNAISSMETAQTESTFASKDQITGKETFYNLYNDGVKVDLSEAAEIAAINSGKTIKTDASYFPMVSTEDLLAKEGSVQPDSIIGDSDDRTPITATTTFPYSCVCQITIYWPDGTSARGTAWMYWKNVAVTAGHCVYSADNGGWATSIQVRPGADGSSSPYGMVYSTRMHTATKWIEDENWEYDYGVLELSSDIGNSTGWFGTSWTFWTLKGTDVTITGYPGEYFHKMYSMSGEITKSDTRKVYYNVIDTTGGQSGSPIYENDYHVIGIHAYAEGTYGNSGTRITSSLFDFFHSFREE